MQKIKAFVEPTKQSINLKERERESFYLFIYGNSLFSTTSLEREIGSKGLSFKMKEKTDFSHGVIEEEDDTHATSDPTRKSDISSFDLQLTLLF